jgi:hypothetical protein
MPVMRGWAVGLMDQTSVARQWVLKGVFPLALALAAGLWVYVLVFL